MYMYLCLTRHDVVCFSVGICWFSCAKQFHGCVSYVASQIEHASAQNRGQLQRAQYSIIHSQWHSVCVVRYQTCLTTKKLCKHLLICGLQQLCVGAVLLCVRLEPLGYLHVYTPYPHLGGGCAMNACVTSNSRICYRQFQSVDQVSTVNETK